MKLKFIENDFYICSLENFESINNEGEFVFTAKTDEEISLVCEEKFVPQKGVIKKDGPWCAFRVEGVLDFSLIGILYKISEALAEKEIGIFVVSTYNTDYVLVKKENAQKAKNALIQKGYSLQ